jgi:hypothetical protein
MQFGQGATDRGLTQATNLVLDAEAKLYVALTLNDLFTIQAQNYSI